jgi:hypothetical protein
MRPALTFDLIFTCPSPFWILTLNIARRRHTLGFEAEERRSPDKAGRGDRIHHRQEIFCVRPPSITSATREAAAMTAGEATGEGQGFAPWLRKILAILGQGNCASLSAKESVPRAIASGLPSIGFSSSRARYRSQF